MPVSALKMVETADPVGACPPDLAPRLPGPVTPLSTFTFGQDDPAERLRRRLASFALAAALEILLFMAIWVLVGRQAPRPLDDDGSAIEMVLAPPEPQPIPPKPQKIELPTLKTIPVRSIPQMRLAIDRILPIPAPQAAPPSAQAMPPSPPPPPTASAEAVDSFQVAVRAAIQAAIIYPPTARMMKQQGRTKVAFTLAHGHAENPQVVQSSGISAIDAAAIAAVLDAAYPAPPQELSARPLQFAVFVELKLAAH